MKTIEELKNKILQGDCLEVMKEIPDNSVDTVITDPPAGISFMGKEWDDDKGGKEHWIAWLSEVMKECLRVAKPGATALVWAIPRTSHWTATAIENAGWEIRDVIVHLFGSGFPKATDISKQLDKGVERKVIGKYSHPDGSGERKAKGKPTVNTATPRIKDGEWNYDLTEPATTEAKLWNGWKSHGLKPASEHWIMAVKKNDGTYVQNALRWGVSGLNIDGGRIGTEKITTNGRGKQNGNTPIVPQSIDFIGETKTGRFPANLILSCECDEIESRKVKGRGMKRGTAKTCFNDTGQVFVGNLNTHRSDGYVDEDGTETVKIHTNPDCPCYMLDKQSGTLKSGNLLPGHKRGDGTGNSFMGGGGIIKGTYGGDKGGASRFFYQAKASKSERNMGCEGLEEKKYKTNITPKEGSIAKYGYEEAKRIMEEKCYNKNHHPTVKPVKLMEYLCTLTKTPTGGTVLDPFMGSGTTGIACKNTGRNFIGIEKDPEYFKIAEARIGIKE